MLRTDAGRTSGVLVSVTATVTAVLLGAAPADAHTGLRTAGPAAGSSGAAPVKMRITFGEQLEDVAGAAITLGGLALVALAGGAPMPLRSAASRA